ncbi:hypothetical protein [Pseudozobellia thermophila]|uniref:hypothetical protein n=1 Tax=Pseudozobellia thermophila TaxID=192903 RepID=UPI001114DF2A|nr:hypothetical protein [Pseudozobellia thermophila]
MFLVKTISFILLLAVQWTGHGQTLTTKEVKILLVVESTGQKVSHLLMFEQVEGKGKAYLVEKYRNSSFYVGLLKGTYEIYGDVVTPKKNTTVIIYTDRELFLDRKTMGPASPWAPGDLFKLGKETGKVVSNSKGELIIKT